MKFRFAILPLTALCLLAAPAQAQSIGLSLDDDTIAARLGGGTVRASSLIGQTLWITEAKVETDSVSEAMTDWQSVGEVNDILITPEGDLQAVLLDIGGFLGVGEHQIAVRMDRLKLVNDAKVTGAYFVVVNSTKDALMKAPAFDVRALDAWEAEAEEVAEDDAAD